MAEAISRAQDTPIAANDNELPENRQIRSNPRAAPEYRAAFTRFLGGGVNALAGEELRALQAGADTDGGYLVAPQQFVAQLIKFLKPKLHNWAVLMALVGI